MTRFELPGFRPGEPIPLKATVKSIRLVRERKVAHEKEVRRLRNQNSTGVIESIVELFREVFLKGQ